MTTPSLRPLKRVIDAIMGLIPDDFRQGQNLETELIDIKRVDLPPYTEDANIERIIRAIERYTGKMDASLSEVDARPQNG